MFILLFFIENIGLCRDRRIRTKEENKASVWITLVPSHIHLVASMVLHKIYTYCSLITYLYVKLHRACNNVYLLLIINIWTGYSKNRRTYETVVNYNTNGKFSNFFSHYSYIAGTLNSLSHLKNYFICNSLL